MRKKFYTRSLFVQTNMTAVTRDVICKTIYRCKVTLIFDGDDINDKKLTQLNVRYVGTTSAKRGCSITFFFFHGSWTKT